MRNISIEKNTLKDRIQNVVLVGLDVDGSINEGDYSIDIVSTIGSMKVHIPGGEDDPELIKRAIFENQDAIFKGLPEQNCSAYVEVLLIECEEWQDVFCNRSYDILKIVRYER